MFKLHHSASPVVEARTWLIFLNSDVCSVQRSVDFGEKHSLRSLGTIGGNGRDCVEKVL